MEIFTDCRCFDGCNECESYSREETPMAGKSGSVACYVADIPITDEMIQAGADAILAIANRRVISEVAAVAFSEEAIRAALKVTAI